MLRRPHDRHRGLRARCDAAPSAGRSSHRHQDRHLMTAQSPSCKTARHARWLSTGHGGVHPNLHLSSPIGRQSYSSATPPTAHSPAAPPSRSLLHPSDLNLPTRPQRSNPHRACRATTRPPCAVSFLGGFRTPAAANMPRRHGCGRHPKPFTHQRTVRRSSTRHFRFCAANGHRSTSQTLSVKGQWTKPLAR